MRGYKKGSENVTKTLKRGKRKEKEKIKKKKGDKNDVCFYVQGLKQFFLRLSYISFI